MSEIKKLIEELCPDGVEFKKLGEVCKINRGVRVVRKELSEEGIYPVYQNSLTPLGYYNKCNYPEDTTFIISAGAAGQIGYSNVAFWAADDCICLQCTRELSSRYLYHFLLHHNNYFLSRVRKASVPRLSRGAIDKFEIPVPPIEVQSKIVEYLDNFTELEAELEAELEGRRKQYEYYRNQLLTFDKDKGAGFDVKWMKLGEIGTFTRGNGLQKADFVDKGFPCIHYGQIYTRYGLSTSKTITYCSEELAKKLVKAKNGDMIIACTSENIEDVCKSVVWLGEGEVATGGHSCVFSHNQEPKYVAYYFQTEQFFMQKKKYANGVKVIDIKAVDMAKITIPIPPIEEQQRIVSILDRFEALTTDLQSGLPAEIEARRKQYEYYREQLLTFERKYRA